MRQVSKEINASAVDLALIGGKRADVLAPLQGAHSAEQFVLAHSNQAVKVTLPSGFRLMHSLTQDASVQAQVLCVTQIWMAPHAELPAHPRGRTGAASPSSPDATNVPPNPPRDRSIRAKKIEPSDRQDAVFVIVAHEPHYGVTAYDT